MIIDCHHHLGAEPDYAERLLESCDRLGVDKVCLMGLPDRRAFSPNAEICRAVGAHPDRLVGFAFVDLRSATPDDVSRFREEGFSGLKFIYAPANYDEPRFDPIYARAQELGMLTLFHLGIVARNDAMQSWRVNCNCMRPIYLDTIARAFPALTVIGAHLGNPWYDEATMAARWNPNLYFDLSGSTLKKKSPEFLGSLLWWTPTTRYRDPEGRYAWEKIVFGSDVAAEEIDDVMSDYRSVMDALQIDDGIRRGVFGDTMERLLRASGA